MNIEKYPILEFDNNKDAIIDPDKLAQKNEKFAYDKLVISFFKEAIDKLLEEKKISEYRLMKQENPYMVYKFNDCDVLLIHGQLGCPACGGNLELLISLGIKKVMFCGGGGVLDKSISVGKLMVVTGAIRDEGFSYHYIKPSRIIYSNKETNALISQYLLSKGIEYFEGITWTTDAFFRETVDKVKSRRDEGAKIVEMEQAGCIAVSVFRNIKYGAIIYGGDDVSSSSWDNRSWRSRNGIRYDLINLCKEIVGKFD